MDSEGVPRALYTAAITILWTARFTLQTRSILISRRIGMGKQLARCNGQPAGCFAGRCGQERARGCWLDMSAATQVASWPLGAHGQKANPTSKHQRPDSLTSAPRDSYYFFRSKIRGRQAGMV